jgi:hypothetical protein
MRPSQHILIAAVATTAMVASAAAAMANNYSGSWPVTMTKSQHSNGTHCLTLGEDGSAASAAVRAHLGQAGALYFGE